MAFSFLSCGLNPSFLTALELVLTARVFKAKEEQASGLFNYVLPKDQVLPKALAIAKEIGE